MPAGDYFQGLLLFGWMLASVAVGTALLVHARFGWLRGVPRVLAFALIATLGVLAVHLVPAALGLLARGSVVVASAAWLVGCWALARRPTGSTAGAEGSASGEDSAWRSWRGLGAAVALSLVAALGLTALADNLSAAPHSIDYLNFHLPGVARWIETGSIWQIDVFLPDVAPGHYPNNGDVILLAAVLPWHDDFLAHLVMYPYWALTGVAVYALARELGALAPAAVVAACLVLAVPAVAAPALSAGLVDVLMFFALTTGLLFLVRHARSGRGSELALAGLALGVAFGTKWYAVSTVAIVFVVWVAARLLGGRPPREVLRQGAAVAGLIALAGGIWMLRNWIESGNPVFPVRVSVLGATIFDAPRDIVRERFGFSLADYFGESGVWGDLIWPQLRDVLAWPSIVIGLGFAAACGLLVRGRRSLPGRGALLSGAAIAVLCLIAYVVTPYTAAGPQGAPVLVGADARYAVPALLVAAPFAAAILRLAPRVGAVLGALALVAIVDGARYSLGQGDDPLSHGAARWLVAAVAAAAVWFAWPRIAPRLRPRVLAYGAVGALAIAVAGAYAVQRDFNDDRYVGADPTTDWVIEHAPSGARIGLAGVWDDYGISPVLPAFGTRLGNSVAYVGRDDDGMLRRYPDSAGFDAALAGGDYDYLIVGLGRPGVRAIHEDAWARAAGYVPVVQSPRLALLRSPSSGG